MNGIVRRIALNGLAKSAQLKLPDIVGPGAEPPAADKPAPVRQSAVTNDLPKANDGVLDVVPDGTPEYQPTPQQVSDTERQARIRAAKRLAQEPHSNAKKPEWLVNGAPRDINDLKEPGAWDYIGGTLGEMFSLKGAQNLASGAKSMWTGLGQGLAAAPTMFVDLPGALASLGLGAGSWLAHKLGANGVADSLARGSAWVGDKTSRVSDFLADKVFGIPFTDIDLKNLRGRLDDVQADTEAEYISRNNIDTDKNSTRYGLNGLMLANGAGRGIGYTIGPSGANLLKGMYGAARGAVGGGIGGAAGGMRGVMGGAVRGAMNGAAPAFWGGVNKLFRTFDTPLMRGTLGDYGGIGLQGWWTYNDWKGGQELLDKIYDQTPGPSPYPGQAERSTVSRFVGGANVPGTSNVNQVYRVSAPAGVPAYPAPAVTNYPARPPASRVPVLTAPTAPTYRQFNPSAPGGSNYRRAVRGR